MYNLTKNNIEIKIEINPLEIRSLKISGVEICYQQDGNWKKNWPFLFPIVGALKDEYFEHKNKKYNLSRHGFFREINTWEIEDEMDGLVSFVAKSNKQFKDVYPFEFEIRNQIEIIDNKLITSYSIKNLEKEKMYFSAGHHPAFKIEDEGLISFEKVETFSDDDDNGLFVRNQKNMKEIKDIRFSEIDFSNGKYYATYKLKSDYLEYSDKNYKMKLNTQDYDIFLLWSTGKDKFICFEPWMGGSDFSDRKNHNISEKDFIICLDPEETYNFELEIELEAIK